MSDLLIDTTGAHRAVLEAIVTKPRREACQVWREGEIIQVQKDDQERSAPAVVTAKREKIRIEVPNIADMKEKLTGMLKYLYGFEGLRDYATLMSMSAQQGAPEVIKWRIDDHLQLQGREPTLVSVEERKEIARRICGLQYIFVRLLSQDREGQTPSGIAEPLFTVPTYYYSGDTLTGMDLRKAPVLNKGIRKPNGELGKNYFAQTQELIKLSVHDFPFAMALGLALPGRWKLEFRRTRATHIDLRGENVLELGKIEYSRIHPGRTWDILEKNLSKLVEIGALGEFYWKYEPNSLNGVLRLSMPESAASRLTGEVKGSIPPFNQGYEVCTGKDLKAWRKRHGLTQARLGALAGVQKARIAKVEREKDGAAHIPSHIHNAVVTYHEDHIQK